jgi:transcriptional regulator with XRE-family HTH domain
MLGRADGRRRRTPGLRREEVAELAGIGVDWYIRLEQGRDVNPSISTIDALAAALRLTDTEHRHLRNLARPTTHPAFERETVPPALRAMVSALSEPAYIVGRRLDVLAWNTAATDLLTDFGAIDTPHRNIAWIMMCDPEAKAVFDTRWSREAKRVVAQFRAAHDLFENDPAFVDLTRQLCAQSAKFRQWWAEHDIATSTSGTKTVSRQGRTDTWAHHSFQSNDNPDLRLVVYTRAAETNSHA